VPIQIPMRREGNRLAPRTQMGADDLATIPPNKDLLVSIRTPRNVEQFELAWVLAGEVANACDWLLDKDEAMDLLKLKCKHVRWVTEPARNGKPQRTYMMPKSIAWESLTQERFERFFNRMIYIVCSDILPGLKESDLRKRIEDICFGKRRAA